MELLLLLTALFASLTGIGSGEARARQVQDVAVVQASKAVQAAVQSADAVQPMVRAAQRLAHAGQHWAVTQAPVPVAASARFERRLE